MQKATAMNEDIYESSNQEIAALLGKRFQEYRKRMGYTQKALSEKTGLSVFTISSFEKGTGTGLSLASFLALMRSIEQLESVANLLPELPESPKTLFMSYATKERKKGNRR